MISFDLECKNGHRFEGVFKDYQSFDEQLKKKLITCPVCENSEIKRLFTGCSIQPKNSDNTLTNKSGPSIQDFIRFVSDYVKENYNDVGKEFAEKARAIHYGIEEHKNIYGESTLEEIKELVDEGIDVLPIPQVDKIEH